MKYKPHVVAVQKGNKISYHYCQSPQDEDKLLGWIVGKYETSHYLKNEKRIQIYHKEQLEKGGK